MPEPYKRKGSRKYHGAFRHPGTGKRVVVPLFSDKQASRAELDRRIKQAEREAAGLVDPSDAERRRPLDEHIDEYEAACRHAGESRVHVNNKTSQLRRLAAHAGATRLGDLTARAIEDHLQYLRRSGRVGVSVRTEDKGLGARSVNQHRATILAFLGWCERTGRLRESPVRSLPRLNEAKDRRRERRAMTEDEVARLIQATRESGRALFYLTAALTGLRRSELAKLEWGHLDLDNGRLTIPAKVGKAGRDDFRPLAPQLQQALAELRPSGAKPSDRVFPRVPRNMTVNRDLGRAGIPLIDESGRHVDLHAMRTTMGTMLARGGVAPQAAAKVLRHRDPRVTNRHYTALDDRDVRTAMAILPGDRWARALTGQRDPGPDSGGEVVAPVVAHGGPDGASGVRTGPTAGPVSVPPAGRDAGAQVGYTQRVDRGCPPGSVDAGDGDHKSISGMDLRAIGAAG
ncbi:MAG: tyrosine-type recombinase/integrase [Phycisphaerales bacterium]|nr:tyrosine-type recombinase/integrase [Phycisphaerales bacterium]